MQKYFKTVLSEQTDGRIRVPLLRCLCLSGEIKQMSDWLWAILILSFPMTSRSMSPRVEERRYKCNIKRLSL